VTGGFDRRTRTALPNARLSLLIQRFREALHAENSGTIGSGWVQSKLTPGEMKLWESMARVDQIHSLRTAKEVELRLADSIFAIDSRWLAVALLHDVGKLNAAQAPHERALAALLGRMVSIRTATDWASSPLDRVGRIGRFLIHGALGAAAIWAVQGREEAAIWAEVHQTRLGGDIEHSNDLIERGIPPEVAVALSLADLQQS